MINIKEFRNNLKKNYNADAVIITMNCSFLDNSIRDISDIELISGFTGSNGIALITQDKAILSIDGRYTTQASLEVDPNIWEIRTSLTHNIIQLVKETLLPDKVLLLPSSSYSYKTYLDIINTGVKTKTISEEHPIIGYRPTTLNVPKLIYSSNPDIEQKLSVVRKNINSVNEAILVGDRNTICWLFEVRREKLNNNKSPLARTIAIITKNSYEILTENDSINKYKQFFIKADYSTIPASFILNHNLKTTNFRYIYNGVKTDSEIENQKMAAYDTSLSLIKTLAYVEHYVKNHEKITETEAINLFTHEKAIDYSFKPICATGKNTSIVHYTAKHNSLIENEALFLFDGGFHFENSSSDMTRTIYIGNTPPEYLRKIYTIVLKSIIFYTLCKFPEKTKGKELDTICRYNMWKYNIDYNFGTGHGVGNYRAVHEKPSISKNSEDEIMANMITTIEPGYYTNDFGIRMENMLLTKKNNEYIEFETINYIPFCKKLINFELLSEEEKEWLSNYNLEIKHKILPIFKADPIINSWIIENLF